MKAGRQRNALLAAVALVAVVAAVPVVNAVRNTSATAAVAVAGDGTTSATAGASCWGIKQQVPSSTDGIYWLNTAALKRPTQFYCDMTTDGGGWVLVGRGRQGWTFEPGGQGSPTTVRTTVDGTGAFSPAALPSATIGQLLNGTAPKDLADGIRLSRASNANGSNRQDVRLYSTGSAWTWAFDTGQLLSKISLNGATYQGSNTYDTAASVAGQTANGLNNAQGTNRLFTFAWANHNNQKGFSYGAGVSGSNSSSSYLWTATNEGDAIPFTQVWIRPRVANSAAGFTTIPSGGYSADPLPAELNNKSEVAPWGVVGIDHTNEPKIEPYNTNVLSLKADGTTMFVGGRFTGVQQGPTGTPVAQPYLAAFDQGGNWISTFRPVVNGRVWNMLVTPDGDLVIAGDFTSVNGAPNTSGMAKLDPTTGAVVSSFKANFGTVTSGSSTPGRVLVRAIDQADGWIYAAGSFNRYTGGTWNTQTVSSAISLRATDGTPGTWRPRMNAQTVRLRVTQAKDRVLMAGYFSSINGDTNQGYFGITDIATGAPSAGIGPWVHSGGATALYQQAVADLGDGRYLVGGSEHDFQMWDRQRQGLIDSTITKQGGDTQAIELIDGKTFFSCHCGNQVYSGTNNWQNPTGFRSVEKINLVGETDTSGANINYDTQWLPSGLKGSHGEGVWAIEKSADDCVWVGGDLIKGAYSGNAATDWLGGFARFCHLDVTPPTAPSSLKASLNGNTVNLSWAGSTDASGTVSYDVYRNDRVIATTYATSYTDPNLVGSARYTVRATDIRGNRSASPAPVAVNGPATKIATLAAFGSTWKYRDDGSNQGTGWTSPSFDDSSWSSGPGQLGWGVTTDATTLSATHPITTYYRTTVQVADASQVKAVNLRTKVLAGAVVYVNGVEAERYNMPAGAITSSTLAAGYLTTAQETAIGSVMVPGSLFKTGANIIAVEVHNNRSGAARSWFDLEATSYGTAGDTAPPTAPTLSATVANSAVTLAWTPSTDDVAMGGYEILRDGKPLAVTNDTATSYVDATVDTTTAHTYQLTAFDNSGNAQGSNVVNLASQANPNILAFGSTWKWTYPTGGLASGWQGTTFDDSSWASGPAELGFGDGDEKTVITTSAAPRPITSYYRATVNITDPTAFSNIIASMIRDDGAVLYVNGVEVGRDNLPSGAITATTPASSAITVRSQETTPVTFTIPSSAFQAGLNTIAVEIHQSDAWSGDSSFDLKLTGQP